MKRIIACFIAAALIMSSSAMAISADSTLVPRDVSMGSFVQAFNDADIQNNFENYTTTTVNVPLRVISSTLNIAMDTPQIVEENTADVVGLVYDRQTQKPVQGATVGVKDLGISATTDKNGRFAIGNMPVGQYDLLITAAGFLDSEYKNMPVQDGAGTEIYSLALDKECAVNETYLAPEIMSDVCMDDCSIPVEGDYDAIEALRAEPSGAPEARLYSPPNLMHLIVKYIHSDGTYEFHSFGSSNIDEYLYYVVPSEMYFYTVKLTQEQTLSLSKGGVKMQIRAVDATGTLEITDSAMYATLDMVLRGTSPDPQPINLDILPDNTRQYTLFDIMTNIDPTYMRTFVQTHNKF